MLDLVWIITISFGSLVLVIAILLVIACWVSRRKTQQQKNALVLAERRVDIQGLHQDVKMNYDLLLAQHKAGKPHEPPAPQPPSQTLVIVQGQQPQQTYYTEPGYGQAGYAQPVGYDHPAVQGYPLQQTALPPSYTQAIEPPPGYAQQPGHVYTSGGLPFS